MKTAQKNAEIKWYRTPLPKETLRALNARSDLKGMIQTAGFLGLVALSGSGCFYAWLNGWWWTFGILLLVYGTVTSFYINGVHELVHGTVFKTKGLNRFFVGVLSFLGIINHHMFWASHAEHHKYTLHPPDDLEVVVPQYHSIRNFLLVALVHVGFHKDFLTQWRYSLGRFEGEWETTLMAEGPASRRRQIVRWSRILLLGHASIAVVSLYFGYWIIPLLVTFSNAYGMWLFWLCNNTQHAGMAKNVNDFRLCCRTIHLNPIVRFLYWNMSWHIEHHMYAAVPCYNLHRLHAAVEHDLPPCPKGLLQAWLQIAAIQRRQKTDPGYRPLVDLPDLKEHV